MTVFANLSSHIVSARKHFVATLRRATRPLRQFWPRLPEATLGLSAIAVVAFALLTYHPTLAIRASRLVSGNKYLALVDGFANPFRTRHLLLHAGYPIYDLKISRQQFAIL